MPEQPDVGATLKQIESLLDHLPPAAEDLVSLLSSVYGAALERVLAAVPHDAKPGLAEDDLVASVLLIHDLHPVSLETRIRRALDRVGHAELASIDAGVAQIRVQANGTPIDSGHLRASIETAIAEEAPDLAGVEIKGLGAAGLVQIAPAPAPRSKTDGSAVCELCGAALTEAHPHVIEIPTRRVLCSCRACHMLFTNAGAAGGRYRSAPERYLHIDAPAEETGPAPVGIVFFVRDSAQQRVRAFYPSPAGATESTASPEAWDELNSAIEALEPDVEALLMARRREQAQCWIVPVDACYELVGRIRTHWRGFDGGDDAWREIDSFFDALRQREAAGVAWAS